ncbi:hypothetical protein [Streptomyces canus]
MTRHLDRLTALALALALTLSHIDDAGYALRRLLYRPRRCDR